ncbi:MAG TPA: hypothetical protein DCQ36_13915 [Actinobacteria bacterium]|nr:hypothetical protein [Actinomycetota bacterium]
MRRLEWGAMKRFLATVVAVVLGVAVVAGIGVFSSVNGAEPDAIVAKKVGTKSTPQGELPHYELHMDVYPNSSAAVPPPRADSPINNVLLSGQPFYGPSTSIEVPANSVVTIHFTQYDSGGQIYNPYFAKVHGTMDGTMTWNGKKVTEIKSNEVGHTFTVHQYPEATQPDFFLSVPLPMNAGNAKTDSNGYPVDPQKVSITFITGDAGTYVWNCEYPCGDMYQEFGGPMQQRGWMAGTFEVVA